MVDASIRPGDVRVPEGSSVAVQAKVEGVIPASAELLRRSGDGPWQSLAMAPDAKAADLFGATVPQAGESFEYQVVAGDGRSQTHRVEVVKRPRVENFALTYTPPAYVAGAPRLVPDSDGEIAAVAGTSVAVALCASKPLKEAAFVTEQGTLIPLSKAADGRAWTAGFRLGSRDVKAAARDRLRPLGQRADALPHQIIRHRRV